MSVQPKFVKIALLFSLLFISAAQAQTPILVQTNANVRIMCANLNGNTQSYQPFALRLLQGLKPDIVCIQEFNYGSNTTNDFRSMIDQAFGTNFSYYREPITQNGPIPNGIISRYPIIASGSWGDAEQSQPNRGFAWARIDLPGTNDLYAISVHLLTKSATVRLNEANALKSLIQSNFPANAWVVIGGDFNTDTRGESALTAFKTFLSDSPIPTDAESGGDADTNAGRKKPYDYVLPSFSLASLITPSVFASHSFSNGLVFDSYVYKPLTDVSPIQITDSTNAQHLAVLKDFRIPYTVTNFINSPALALQSTNVLHWQGQSNLVYRVQSTTNLSSTNWITLGTASATGTNLSYTNGVSSGPQRYFRIVYP